MKTITVIMILMFAGWGWAGETKLGINIDTDTLTTGTTSGTTATIMWDGTDYMTICPKRYKEFLQKQYFGASDFNCDETWSSYAMPLDGERAYEVYRKLKDEIDGDVIWALETALKYLQPKMFTETIYYTPAERLRRQADAIEQKEADMSKIKDILEALK